MASSSSSSHLSFRSFRSLRDALQITDKTDKSNLFVVVVEAGIPKKSAGTDYFCTWKIVDESHQDPPIALTIFNPSPAGFPNVSIVGAVILLSKIWMDEYDGKTVVKFHKNWSSYAIFGGKLGDPSFPYTSLNYRQRDWRSLIASNLTMLRNWLSNYQFSAGRDHISSLKDITKEVPFDLVCKIMHICATSRTLYVWNGTDTPPMQICPVVENGATAPLALHVGPYLSEDVMNQLHMIGSTIRVEVSSSIVIDSLVVNQWIRLHELVGQEHVYSGMWTFEVGHVKHSTILHMSNEDEVVMEYIESYKARLQPGIGWFPQSSNFPPSSPITVIDETFLSMPWLSLLTSIQNLQNLEIMLTDPYIAPNIPCDMMDHHFRCVVRVVAIHPWNVNDSNVPIMLTLEDPTTRIHAHVLNRHLDKLFKGHDPHESFAIKRNKLLGVVSNGHVEDDESQLRNPPWVDMVLHFVSFRGKRSLNIRGTTII